jgi:hypothetical protein
MTFKSLRVTLLAGVAMAAIAGPAVADVLTTPIALIPVPATQANVQPGGAFTSFDISFADPVLSSAGTGNIFIADRSNASVDIVSGSSLTVLGQALGFAGQTGNNNTSGADGVLTVTSGAVTTLYAGDGNSTLKVFNVTTTATTASATLQTSIATAPAATGMRVDEMAFNPRDSQVLAANNAASPAFGSLFSTSSGHSPVTLQFPNGPPNTLPNNQITIAGQAPGGGLEQPAWNPGTTVNGGASFWISVPAFTTAASDPGGVAQISTAGKVVSTTSFAGLPGLSSAGCAPSGLAVATNGNMLVGCNTAGPSQAVLLDKNGNFLQFVGSGVLGGTDEIWYDPTTNAFYVTGGPGGSNPGTRFFGVVDPNGNLLATVDVPTTSSAHSITVDPVTGDVFVALAGSNAAGANMVCPLGCIAVFSSPVPGPIAGAGLPGLILAAGGLVALARRRRQKIA